MSSAGFASRGAADERGITLQTLIVTAVLVLMAVAAGVVIVAITNSSSDDLEESGSDVQGRCTSVEIYDPVVASRNEKGVNIANTYRYGARLPDRTRIDDINDFEEHHGYAVYEYEGSAIGCIPVCVWRDIRPDPPAGQMNVPDGILQPGEVVFVRDLSETDIRIRRTAYFKTEQHDNNPDNNYVLAAGSSRAEITAYVSLEGHLTDEMEPYAVHQDSRVLESPIPGAVGNVAGKVDRVAVAPNQNECHTYDAAGNVLL